VWFVSFVVTAIFLSMIFLSHFLGQFGRLAIRWPSVKSSAPAAKKASRGTGFEVPAAKKRAGARRVEIGSGF
jgi:hypothetical protein